MKHILMALILACFPGVGGEAPSEVYPVTIEAEYQGHTHASTGLGMHTEIEIRNAQGVELAHMMTVRLPPYYLEVSEPPPYLWRNKGLFHLASGGVSETGIISAGVQYAGDIADYVYDPAACPQGIAPCIVTGDNVVDVADYSKLRRWFGAERPCCGDDFFRYALADLDGDGIGITDFNLLVGPNSWGHSGYEFVR
jgi:hypothetical protein